MRIIVACHQCDRQYDASGIAPGKRFSCRCGVEVTVVQPRGHTASVVRCSSCGAGRQRAAKACGHCGGDFTIHEQDLQTVCPKCLARVSDQARYCHHCAALLVADPIAGDETNLPCPVCGPGSALTSRQLRGSLLPVMECQLCGGFWVGQETFERLLDREMRQPTHATAPRRKPDVPAKTPYRPCAACGELMVRWNFGRSSGVLVDVCRQHGIWFDCQELAHVLRWIRSGNLHAAQGDLVRLRKSTLKTRRAPAPHDAVEPGMHSMHWNKTEMDDPIDIALEAVADAISRFFGVYRQ